MEQQTPNQEPQSKPKKSSKGLIITIIILALLAIGAYFLFSGSPESEAQVVNEPTDVQQVTPEGVKGLRLFQVNYDGDEQLENTIVFTEPEGDKEFQRVQVLTLEDEWKVKVETSFPAAGFDENWKIEGVQKIDLDGDEEQEFFILVTSDQRSSHYRLVDYKDGRYSILSRPEAANDIALAEEETAYEMTRFRVLDRAIQEEYSIFCGEEVCREETFEVILKDGRLIRTSTPKEESETEE